MESRFALSGPSALLWPESLSTADIQVSQNGLCRKCLTYLHQQGCTSVQASWMPSDLIRAVPPTAFRTPTSPEQMATAQVPNSVQEPNM